MTNLYKEVNTNLHEQQELFEMANIQPWESGLKSEINVLFNGKKTSGHQARVKVLLSDNATWFPVPVFKEPNKRLYNKLKQDDKLRVDEVIKYVTKHGELFQQHWNGDITDYELFTALKLKKKSKPKVGAV